MVALVIVPTAVLTVLACCGLLDKQLASRYFWTSIVYLKFFGWRLVYWVFVPVVGYVSFSGIAYAAERRRRGPQAPGTLPPTAGRPASWASQRYQAARSCARLVAACGYALAVHLITVNALCSPDRQKVAWVNELLMRADHAIFGTYVPFEMHEQLLFQSLSAPLVFCYLKLSLAMAVVFVGLCMFQFGRFRQFVLAFLTIGFLAQPIWFALPATTPDEAYRLNRVGVKVPLEIGLETAAPIAHLNHDVFNLLEQLEPFQSVPAGGRFFITSLPSMHVAWGILVVWFGATLDRRLAIVLIAWGLLNAVGAVFTLQHYAVDAVAGGVVTVVAVALVRGLIALEARCGLRPPPGYGIFAFIRRDAASLGRAMWPLRSARRAIPAGGAPPAGRRRTGWPPA
jgi:hypothetical protein